MVFYKDTCHEDDARKLRWYKRLFTKGHIVDKMAEMPNNHFNKKHNRKMILVTVCETTTTQKMSQSKKSLEKLFSRLRIINYSNQDSQT